MFRQLQLAFCLEKEEKRRAWERRGRRERRGETEEGIEGRCGGRACRQTKAGCDGWLRTVWGEEGGKGDGFKGKSLKGSEGGGRGVDRQNQDEERRVRRGKEKRAEEGEFAGELGRQRGEEKGTRQGSR